MQVGVQLRHRFVARFDLAESTRAGECGAQQALAHRRWQQSSVWKRVTRGVLAGEERLDQFEIAHRDLVEFESGRSAPGSAARRCGGLRSSGWCAHSAARRRRRWRRVLAGEPEPRGNVPGAGARPAGRRNRRPDPVFRRVVRVGSRSNRAGFLRTAGSRTSRGPPSGFRRGLLAGSRPGKLRSRNSPGRLEQRMAQTSRLPGDCRTRSSAGEALASN